MKTEREHIKRDGPGRRQDDKLKCPWCDIRWDNLKEKWVEHDKDKDTNRDLVCTKIKEIKEMSEKMVPRWIFTMIIGIMISISTTVLGFFSLYAHKGQEEIKSSLVVIHRRITETSNDADVIKDMVRDVQRQQAIIDTKLFNLEESYIKNKK